MTSSAILGQTEQHHSQVESQFGQNIVSSDAMIVDSTQIDRERSDLGSSGVVTIDRLRLSRGRLVGA